jgi:nicotinamide-nucleotide amidase
MSERTGDTNPIGEIAALAAEHGFRVGVAESLTSGQLAADLGAGPSASDWFRGGLVAYASEVKFDVLGVPPGPVVTATCARQMALGVASLVDADAVVATTGVGGPESEEGESPGTVYVAALVRGRETCRRLDLAGEPPEVLAQTRRHALGILLEAMRAAAGVTAPRPRGTAHDAGPAGSPSRAASR